MLRRRQIVRIGEPRRHRGRHPEVGASAEAGKRRRQHPDDRERHAVDADRAADDGGIGRKASLPQPGADERDGMAARYRVFFGKKRAPEVWRHAQRA